MLAQQAYEIARGSARPYMGAMQNLDLTEDETAALVALLTLTIADDRYPRSPRVFAP